MEKPEVKGTLGRHRRSWEGNIKMTLPRNRTRGGARTGLIWLSTNKRSELLIP